MANLADSSVDAVVGIEMKIFSPQALNNFFAADQPSILTGEKDQQVHGDALEAHWHPIARQFITADVEDKFSK